MLRQLRAGRVVNIAHIAKTLTDDGYGLISKPSAFTGTLVAPRMVVAVLRPLGGHPSTLWRATRHAKMRAMTPMNVMEP
jgi:hypothetical protein